MSDQPVIFHNPHCSKSRKALSFLTEAGANPDVVRYLEAPPTRGELDRICSRVGLAPQDLVRTSEPLFKELGLSLEDDRGREGWLAVLEEHPRLLERPIIVMGDKAIVGRPPERVLELLK